jgi:hypothetical protein
MICYFVFEPDCTGVAIGRGFAGIAAPLGIGMRTVTAGIIALSRPWTVCFLGIT